MKLLMIEYPYQLIQLFQIPLQMVRKFSPCLHEVGVMCGCECGCDVQEWKIQNQVFEGRAGFFVSVNVLPMVIQLNGLSVQFL